MFTAAPLIVRVFQMETASAARLGFAVVYSATPDSVRVFQIEARNICGIFLSHGALLIHNHPDGVVTV